MSLPQLNPVEPPWYGPVCPVVGEGWHREVSPYPDQQRFTVPVSSKTPEIGTKFSRLREFHFRDEFAVDCLLQRRV